MKSSVSNLPKSALGHSRADVTQIYAEANQEKARELALQIG